MRSLLVNYVNPKGNNSKALGVDRIYKCCNSLTADSSNFIIAVRPGSKEYGVAILRIIMKYGAQCGLIIIMNLACLSALDPVGPTTISHSPADYHQTKLVDCGLVFCTITVVLYEVCATEIRHPQAKLMALLGNCQV